MVLTQFFPDSIAYPAAAIVSTFYLSAWQMVKVGRARKTARIPYPQLYAEKAEAAASNAVQIFNCTQRAHQNTLESFTGYSREISTTIMALNYPIAAAGLCGCWTIARVLYTIGYSTGDPARRNLMGAAGLSAVSLIGLVLGSTLSVANYYCRDSRGPGHFCLRSFVAFPEKAIVLLQ
ncbi:membrane-associated proteins in eicosanoid and glutathione metabolism [Amylocystis lapponica]|nr:membrane-associated proteins in eicosanoid and glutathione metabolism [Amylocystis lapponica]